MRSRLERRVFGADFPWRYKSAEKKVIAARGKALVDTQLSVAVPPGTYGRVAPRSGLGKLTHSYIDVI